MPRMVSSTGMGSFRFPANIASGATFFSDLKLGAGGNITGISIAPDGTMAIRNDTYGGHWWNPNAANPGNAGGSGKWVQVLTLSSMPVANLTIGAGDNGIGVGAAGQQKAGIAEIVVAPSRSARLYQQFYGWAFRSEDNGASWQRLTGFGQSLSGGNPPGTNGNELNGGGPYIAVDPINPDVVYISDIYSNLKVSTDAGTTWNNVTAVSTSTNTTPNSAGHIIAFDTNGGTSGGRTSKIYVHTAGVGLFCSTNQGGSFSACTSGGPTGNKHTQIKVGPTGTVWLTDNATGLWKYTGGTGGTWTNVTLAGSVQCIAIDPTNALKLVTNTGGGQFNFSTDGGTTWSGVTAINPTKTANDIPWLAWTNEGGTGNFGVTAIEFDPSRVNTVIVANGIGVWEFNPSYTSSAQSLTSKSAGIEQLVGTYVLCPPGGKPFVCVWDRGGMYIDDYNLFPSVHATNSTDVNSSNLIYGGAADWASSSPSTLFGIFEFVPSFAAKSTDGGATWTDIADKTPFGGGNTGYGSVACSSATNWVWFPSRGFGGGSNRPYYTTNGGTNWTLCSFPVEIPTTGSTGWAFNPGFGQGNQKCVAADRVTAGKFYAYNWSVDALYVSTDSGANWTRQFNGTLNTGLGALSLGGVWWLKTVPSNAGHLFFGARITSSFVFSNDAGVTWNTVNAANFQEVIAFGFGAVWPGQSYPSILVFTQSNGTFGFFQCTDFNPSTRAGTWTNVTSNFNSGDVVIDIDGDKSTPGLWIITVQGSGGKIARRL